MPAVKKPQCVLREEKIVKAFKIALIEKGWTTQHLAELMHTDKGRISRIINHPMSVRFETVLNLASKLGIDSIPIL